MTASWCVQMHMLRTFHCTLAFALVLLVLPAASQQELLWQKGLLLSAKDFQAAPDNNSPHAAATYSGVRYGYDYSTNPLKLRFEVTAFFVPERSWIKHPESDDLVAHEQLHFDISELHARKLRKAFATTTFGRDFQRRIKEIYADNNAERKRMQAWYDSETDHGRNRDAQQRWYALVHDALNRLAMYAGKDVIP